MLYLQLHSCIGNYNFSVGLFLYSYSPFFPQNQMPFAVVGSDKSHTVDGREVLGRLTNWGLIEGKDSISDPDAVSKRGSRLRLPSYHHVWKSI